MLARRDGMEAIPLDLDLYYRNGCNLKDIAPDIQIQTLKSQVFKKSLVHYRAFTVFRLSQWTHPRNLGRYKCP